MRILVVDDVGYIRHLLQRVLERHGHTVITAPNGLEALRTLHRDPNIRLVVTDLMLPDIDGVELYRQAIAVERCSDHGRVTRPEFVLITALRDNDAGQSRHVDRMRQAKSLGIRAVLQKPIDQRKLLRIVGHLDRNLDEGDLGERLLGLSESVERLRTAAQERPASADNPALLDELADVESRVRTLEQQLLST